MIRRNQDLMLTTSVRSVSAFDRLQPAKSSRSLAALNSQAYDDGTSLVDEVIQ